MSPETPPRAITFGYAPENDLWPFTLMAGAVSFLRVADSAIGALAPINADDQNYLTPLFLLGHSLELSLKAFLRFRGRSEQELLDLDHRLPAVFDAAVSDGFPKGHPCDRKLLNLLDLTYGSRRLLYPRASAVSYPFLRPVRDLAVDYLRIASGGNQLWPDDSVSEYGSPSLHDLREHSQGTDLRQLAVRWVQSTEAGPQKQAANLND